MKKFFTIVYLVVVLICLIIMTISEYSADRVNKSHTENNTAAQNTDLKSIESVDFEMDMEKMEVVLIKRSILDSNEVTIVELANGRTQTIVCSRDIHDRIVEKFRRILLKRNNGF